MRKGFGDIPDESLISLAIEVLVSSELEVFLGQSIR